MLLILVVYKNLITCITKTGRARMFRKIVKESLMCLISSLVAAGLLWLLINRVSSDLIVMAVFGFIALLVLIRYCCCEPLRAPTVERRVASYEPVLVEMPPITTNPAVRVHPPPYIILQNPGYIYHIGFLDRRIVP